MEIKIYRKDTGAKRPNPKAADLARLKQELELRCRVRRPMIESLFIPAKAGGVSDFYKLPALSQKVIDNRPVRVLDHADKGVVVDPDSLGRSGAITKGTCDSINIWITDRLSAVVNPEDFSVVVE